MTKKIGFIFGCYIVGLIVISTFNQYYLLWSHPLSYYYTIAGMWDSTKLMLIEVAIVTPIGAYLCKRTFSTLSEKNTTDNDKIES